ncbi:hypothetical protein OHT57_06510 [Streptomyces sp. NBC_00285]|nr:hypothetical protein [Streptomyces sp. NBC_00285]
MTEHDSSDYTAYADRVWSGEETLLPHFAGGLASGGPALQSVLPLYAL